MSFRTFGLQTGGLREEQIHQKVRGCSLDCRGISLLRIPGIYGIGTFLSLYSFLMWLPVKACARMAIFAGSVLELANSRANSSAVSY